MGSLTAQSARLTDGVLVDHGFAFEPEAGWTLEEAARCALLAALRVAEEHHPLFATQAGWRRVHEPPCTYAMAVQGAYFNVVDNGYAVRTCEWWLKRLRCCGAYGSYWHEADIECLPPNVRFRGKADVANQYPDVR